MRPARTPSAVNVLDEEVSVAALRARLRELEDVVRDARNVSLALQEAAPSDEDFAKMALATLSVVLDRAVRR